ncbi:MAG: putative Ig domain-containing protein [Bryobacteraceae bacterium]
MPSTKRLSHIGLAVAAAFLSILPAYGSVATFDSFADGASLTNQLASAGIVANGILVSSNTFGGAISPSSSPNYLRIVDQQTITFVRPLNAAVNLSATNVSIVALGVSAIGQIDGATIQAFDINGNLIDTKTVNPAGPNVTIPNQTLTFSGSVHQLKFTRIVNPNGSGTMPFDDLRYSLQESSGSVTVPGTANPYLAGMPNGSGCCGDAAPAQSPVLVPLAVKPGATLRFTVAGSVLNFDGTPVDPPDGSSPQCSSGPVNGMSQICAPLNSLVGVFLDANQPDGTAAPAGLDFGTLGIDFPSFSPQLKQVFFIGDGGSVSGTQDFIVPAGATRLYLAANDGYGWFNNTGAFSVNVTQTYVAYGIDALNSTRFTVNKDTGSVSYGPSTLYAGIQSLDFMPDRKTLYGVGLNNYAPNSPQSLLLIDRSSAVTLPVGPTGLTNDILDIAIRGDGTIFGVDTGGSLYTFSRSTGTATLVGDLGIGAFPAGGLAFAQGTLYLTAFVGNLRAGSTNFYTVNQTTGAATLVGPVDFSAMPQGSEAIVSMKFEPFTDELYLNVVSPNVQIPTTHLAKGTITPTGLTLEDIGDNTLVLDSLAFGQAPEQALYLPATLPVGTVNVPYTTNVINACSICDFPPAWAISSGSLPSGVTVATQFNDAAPYFGSAIFTGTPTQAGAFPFSLQHSATAPIQDYTMYISSGPLSIVQTSLPGGGVGQPYSFALTPTGGVPGGYTWSLLSGPPWLTINPATGQLGGTPTAIGNLTVVAQVMDIAGQTAFRSYSLGVINPVVITTVSVPSGVVGAAYSTTISASGGTLPLTWSMQPPVVNGLSINSSTGTITGTPLAAGGFTLNVTVVDSAQSIATVPFPISVINTLGITTTSIPGSIVGVPYSTVIAAGGGIPPYTWSLPNSTVNGLSINPSTGQLSGTPIGGGVLPLSVTVTDSTSVTSTKVLSLNSLAVGTSVLPGGTVGLSYSASLNAFGASPSATWSLAAGNSLPPGLTLSSAGAINGSPSSAGSFPFTVVVTDTQGSASKALAITVAPGLSITTKSLPDGTVGTAYAANIQAANGNGALTFSLSNGSLPSGLTLASNGAISGTPTTSGASSFTVSVKDANNVTASASLSINVSPAPVVVTITTTALPGGFVNTAYATTLGATPSSTWSIVTGTLPAGLNLNTSTGAITGTPSAAGSATFTVKATSGNGSAQKQFAIAIATPPSVNVTGLPSSIGPGQQPAAQVALSSTYPVTVNGTLTLTFAASGGGDNPEVRFGNGTRTANFTVAPGSTGGLFGAASNVAVITGTVAGTITITTTANDANGLTVPPPAPIQITVTATVPLITSVKLVPVTGGFNVVVTGFSNTKNMVSGQFNFTPTAGNTLNPSSVTIQLSTLFSAWYSSPASAATGSQFSLTMPFTTGGNSAFPVASVSVTLTNSQGTSNPVSSN